MYISARERAILTLLVGQEKALPIRDIAKELEVSTRTIQRDLKGIENILEKFQLSLQKEGSTLSIKGEAERQRDVMSYIGGLEHEEFTPEERQVVLLSYLLRAVEPVKLYTLANELHVTVATVSADLQKAEKWLEAFSLQIVRKRGYGVEVVGDEWIIRTALKKLISENLSEDYFYHLLSRDDIEPPTVVQVALSRLFYYVDVQVIKDVKQVIDEWRQAIERGIVDSSYVSLIIHVTLAVERIKANERIQLSRTQLEKMQEEQEYGLAENLASKLSKVLEMDIPEEEIGYFAMHIHALKWVGQKDEVLYGSDLILAVQVKSLIEIIASKYHLHFDDQQLYKGLFAHMKPALYRIEHKMKIHNPLLAKIKEAYQELFDEVTKAVMNVFKGIAIPEEEIGFIVMHFGSAIELRRMKVNIRALVICSSGIGSSKLLASRLKKEFTEITELHHASLFDLREEQIEQYDLVISTGPIPGRKDYIYVRPYLDNQEVKEIRTWLDEYIHKQKNLLHEFSKQQKELVQRHELSLFERLHDVNQDVLTILHHFEARQLASYTMEENLTSICAAYVKKGALHAAADVVTALLARENSGGLAIPGTHLALFHTRHKDIKEPVFSVYELEEGMYRKGMDDQPTFVKRVLLLLAPEEMEEHRLLFISSISASIIENDASIHLYEYGQEAEIKAYLVNQFKQYLQEMSSEG
ncbi:BglG family transcription antiterminator [Metasolibacillus meyeri]|uniref:BglG family transcription antiterminator n=1 Tax=Metasolibacillus meyeri TaxID=1071052 RepID=UPI000D303A4E|nr:BglG family transcription antiterminator [Metasolibacillus meyeri]